MAPSLALRAACSIAAMCLMAGGANAGIFQKLFGTSDEKGVPDKPRVGCEMSALHSEHGVDASFNQKQTCIYAESTILAESNLVDESGHCWLDNKEEAFSACLSASNCFVVVHNSEIDKWEPRKHGKGLVEDPNRFTYYKTCSGEADLSRYDEQLCSLMDDNSLALISNTIYYKANHPIAGFQFDMDMYEDAQVTGGIALTSGFQVQHTETILIGFSMSAKEIPEGCGPMLIFSEIKEDAKIDNLIMANKPDKTGVEKIPYTVHYDL